ncbi:DoxX family membrane protein [Sorangium sp. So ce269]
MTTQAMPAAEVPATKSFARYIPTVARVLLGLLFFASGLMGFLLPPPDPSTVPPGVAAFDQALRATGYLLPLIKGTEVIAGLLLLSNRFVPLALAILAPVVVNIFAVHAILAPSGLVVAAVVVLLEVYLAWAYRGAFRPMLAMRAKPGST